ncbi:MAG: MBL fold metallo-hydrolase [Pseudomonadota bacterium]
MKNLRVAVAAMLALPVTAISQDIATEASVEQVADGIYLIGGANGFSSNIALLAGDEHVLLIDNGMAPLGPDLMATIEELAGRAPDFIVNTHHHGDHVGNNAVFADDGTLVFAHENLRKRVVIDPTAAGGQTGIPTITFHDEIRFHVNDNQAQVIHMPAAHTDGDAIVFFKKKNVIDAGDIMFNYLFPFIDLDSGGTVAGYIAAQQKMVDMSDEETKIIPGHGPLASKADMEANLATLAEGSKRVQALVDDGKNLAEIQTINPLADFHDTYNWGFITTERMTATFYRDITGKTE